MIALSSKEYALLHFLMSRPREVLSRTTIAEHVWDYDAEHLCNVIDVYIGYLRQKLCANGEPDVIHTKRGAGYQLVPAAQDEIRALAVTLNDMLNALDQTMARQRRFVANASHELRTPVAVIRNKTSIALLQPQKRQKYIAVLHEINTEAERLGKLISDLLALARGDEGHVPFEREATRLDVLVEATAASLQPLAEERAVQLTVHAEQPVTLVGDEARLIQVVMNLLENALRNTGAGGQVSLMVQPGPDQVQVVVQDTGIGIAPEHLPHLFERFYQVDPARSSAERGNHGLGLSIVAWIVQVHGGTIAVTSQPGQGSCFTVTLPLIPPAPTNETR